MGATIAPEKILRELAEMWMDLGEQGEAVLRACSMTLVVLADESDDPGQIAGTLASLMPEHPSRAVVIRVRPSAARSLSARVFAQCHTPFGGRRHICCEQVEISASDASLPDLPPLLLPIVVPDLPVVVWYRRPRFFGLLTEIADKVIADSAAFADPVQAMEQLAALRRPAADLAWTRLTRWRELVSQVFQSQACLERLPRIHQVRVSHPRERPPVAAWYLAAWLLDGVTQAGGRAALEMKPLAASMQMELIGPDLRVSVACVEGGAAEVRVDGVVRRAAFPAAGESRLLRDELFIIGRDPIFVKTLAAALRLALSS